MLQALPYRWATAYNLMWIMCQIERTLQCKLSPMFCTTSSPVDLGMPGDALELFPCSGALSACCRSSSAIMGMTMEDQARATPSSWLYQKTHRYASLLASCVSSRLSLTCFMRSNLLFCLHECQTATALVYYCRLWYAHTWIQSSLCSARRCHLASFSGLPGVTPSRSGCTTGPASSQSTTPLVKSSPVTRAPLLMHGNQQGFHVKTSTPRHTAHRKIPAFHDEIVSMCL